MERKLKKAIIHLGTEKTGSTTLQRFFNKNRTSISQQGFYFMKSTGITNDTRLVGYCLPRDRLRYYLFRNLGINTPEKKDKFDKEFLSNFRYELCSISKNIHTVIFSSEFFHSRLKDSSQRIKLKSLIENYFDEIVIVTYIRPQIEMNISLYSTSLKSGPTTASLEEHLMSCHEKNYYYNYGAYLSGWESDFVGSEIKVKIFDKNELCDGDVVKDFCETFGLDVTPLLSISKENESLTPTGQEIMRVLNRVFPYCNNSKEKSLLRKSLKNAIAETFAGKGRKPDSELARNIQNRFYNINESVRIKYFPDRAELFDIDYDAYNNGKPIKWDVVQTFEWLIVFIESWISAMPNVNLHDKHLEVLRKVAVDVKKESEEESHYLMEIVSLLKRNG